MVRPAIAQHQSHVLICTGGRVFLLPQVSCTFRVVGSDPSCARERALKGFSQFWRVCHVFNVSRGFIDSLSFASIIVNQLSDCPCGFFSIIDKKTSQLRSFVFFLL